MRGGFIAIVDDDDFEQINQYKWFLQRGYARRQQHVYLGVNKYENVTFSMHRMIMGLTDPKIEVDHINHNKLDNRKCNLRICNRNGNVQNTSSCRNSSSKYIGVCWDKRDKVWIATVKHNGKQVYRAYFKNEVDAAKERDRVASIYHGEFANLNFK